MYIKLVALTLILIHFFHWDIKSIRNNNIRNNKYSNKKKS